MQTVKKLLLGLLILVLLLVGALAAVPFLFRDQLIETVRTEVNDRINAEVTFEDVDISLFRSFPSLTLAFSDLAVTGVDTFAGLPLMKASTAAIDLDLMSVIRGGDNIRINGVALVEPEVRILVLANGLTNYDIAKPSDTDDETAGTESSEINFALDHYSVEDGYFVYDDRAAETYLELVGLDHTGTGNFTLEEFDLDTESTVDAVTFGQGGLTYFSGATAILDAVFHINTTTSTYTLKDNELLLNELVLNFDGFVALPNEEDIQMDFQFNAPVNDFRQLWSIIPAAYTSGYENVKTQGQFTLDGFVKGIYNGEREVYPSFAINARVDNGQVQYPDLPLPIQNIIADIQVNSPTSELNDLVINVTNLNLQVGQDPVRARFRLATPISDPQVAATVQGVIDLEQWSRAFPLEDVEQLDGRIAADVDIDTRASTIEAGRYADVKMDGDLTVTDLTYRAVGLPPVEIIRAVADFQPRAVNLTEFSANLGRSDIQATGDIRNILAYFSPEMTMRGALNFTSNYFLADEWIPEEEESTQPLTPAERATGEAPPAGSGDTELFDRFDFRVNGTAREIVYDTYQLRDSEITGRVMANRLEIDRVTTRLGETDLNGSGTILNAFDYTFAEGVLGGTLKMNSSFFNVDDFMTETQEDTPATSAEAESAVIPVPENINLVIDVVADRVKYTDINLNEMAGKVYVREGRVIVENGSAALLGGQMDFSGAYDTSEPGDPGFEFHYDMQSLDFNAAFATLNSFAALAPIGKFINGKLNTDLIISGKLGQDLFPKLNTIDAQGFLQTLDAQLSGFKPAATIGNALRIKELQERIDLKNVKSWFKVEDGQVTVEPFNVKIGDARMLVQGTHGLTSDMNYQIQAAVPRGMIEGNFAGAAVSQGLSRLGSQAQKLGLNIEQGDTLNLAIRLTGSIADPKVGFDLLGMGGQGFASADSTSLAGTLRDEATGRIDSARQEARDQVATAKEQVEESVDRTLDSVRTAAKDRAAELEQQAKDRLRGAIGLPADSTRRDSTTTGTPTEELKKGAEEIKKELEKFNPFRKKKSGGSGG